MVFKKQPTATTATNRRRLLPLMFGRSRESNSKKGTAVPLDSVASDTQAEESDNDSSSSPGSSLSLHSQDFGTGALKIRSQRASLKCRYGSSQCSSSSSSSSSVKRVNFSQATIHYHDSVLGDSPSVSTGMTLSLGNELVHQETVEIVENSSSTSTTTPKGARPQRSSGWGGPDPLVIPAKARKQILLNAGVPQSEIDAFLLRLKISKLPPSVQKTYLKQLEGGQDEQKEQQ